METRANGHSNGRNRGGPHLEPESVKAGDPAEAAAVDGDVYGSVGDWLAARRRALGYSLEEVETATRVREDYLAAIEDMDPRRMPAGPYAPGFVRTYAAHLDLDPEIVAARFREEMSPRRLRATPQAKEPAPRLKIRTPAHFWLILAGVAALGALVVIGWRLQSGDEFASVPPVPEGLSDWVASDIESRQTSTAPELVVGPDLALRARVPVSFEAHTGDGEVLISRTLGAGEVWTAPRVRGVLVSTDNAGAVEVLLDGRPQGRLGAPGLPVTNWAADPARGLEPPAPPPAEEEIAPADVGEAVAGEAATAAPAAETAEIAEVAGPDDAESLLDDLAAEEALVTPDLPPEPEITVAPLPDLELGQAVYAPDADEPAAAEGRAVGLGVGADAPDVE